MFSKVTKIRTQVSGFKDFVNAGPNNIFYSQVKNHSGVIVVTLKQATNKLYPNIERRTQMLKKQKLPKMFRSRAGHGTVLLVVINFLKLF